MLISCLRDQKILAEKAQKYLVLCGKEVKLFKERNTFQKIKETLSENLGFAENCNFIRADSNSDILECSCSKRFIPMTTQTSYKILLENYVC